MTDLTQERIRIDGPRGTLDAELVYPSDRVLAAALLLNPHPLMGGRMENNLIRALAGGLPSRGIATLRFDYSGVGESDGPRVDVAETFEQFWRTSNTDADPLMVDDARACREWLRRQMPMAIGIVGYSFGAFVASVLGVEDGPAAAGFVLVAPTIRQHDYPLIDAARTPLLVVGCEDDFATERAGLEAWMDSIPMARRLILPGTDHFFRGREDEVVVAGAEFIRCTVAARHSEVAA